MSDYKLSLTASEIDIALEKAYNPDTAPLATDNLVTSGGVKTYVDNAIAAFSSVSALNIVQSVKTDLQIIQGATSLVWQDITDLEVSITPKISNSKLLIRADVCSTSSTTKNPVFRILVDGAVVGAGDIGYDGIQCSFIGNNNSTSGHSGMSYLYSGTLSAGQSNTIKIQAAKSGSRDVYVNGLGSISQIMVTEIYQ